MPRQDRSDIALSSCCFESRVLLPSEAVDTACVEFRHELQILLGRMTKADGEEALGTPLLPVKREDHAFSFSLVRLNGGNKGRAENIVSSCKVEILHLKLHPVLCIEKLTSRGGKHEDRFRLDGVLFADFA